jgi:hypothetical protein
MADVNGITKSDHATMVTAQFHALTQIILSGLNVLSLVFLPHIVLRIVCSSIVHHIVSQAVELIALLSALKKESAPHILMSAIKCVSLVNGVLGPIAVLNTAGVNAVATEASLNRQLVVKFAHNCTKLTDATTSLLQITALGPLGVIGVLALPLAVPQVALLPATRSATWLVLLVLLITPQLVMVLIPVLLSL